MDCSVLILSCDKYDDLWEMFFKLKNKYWKDCPYETYISTETKQCPYAKTINVDTEVWTNRIRESLKQIDSKYVIIMCEDFFIREKADQKRIDTLFANFKPNTATFNFELSYSSADIESEFDGWGLRPNMSKYMLSCQPAIWNKDILIELLDIDGNAWQWEQQIIDSKYDFYINKTNYIIDIGYKDHKPFSVKQGKWCREIIPFFEKENIEVDYEKRGFYE